MISKKYKSIKMEMGRTYYIKINCSEGYIPFGGFRPEHNVWVEVIRNMRFIINGDFSCPTAMFCIG